MSLDCGTLEQVFFTAVMFYGQNNSWKHQTQKAKSNRSFNIKRRREKRNKLTLSTHASVAATLSSSCWACSCNYRYYSGILTNSSSVSLHSTTIVTHWAQLPPIIHCCAAYQEGCKVNVRQLNVSGSARTYFYVHMLCRLFVQLYFSAFYERRILLHVFLQIVSLWSFLHSRIYWTFLWLLQKWQTQHTQHTHVMFPPQISEKGKECVLTCTTLRWPLHSQWSWTSPGPDRWISCRSWCSTCRRTHCEYACSAHKHTQTHRHTVDCQKQQETQCFTYTPR